MPTIAVAIPILPGKSEAFRSASRRWVIERHEEFEASRRRLGIRVERGFLQPGPQGDLAIVVLEVDDPAQALGGLAASPEPFDVAFRAYLFDTFGWAPAHNPSMPSEVVFDWRIDA